MFSDRDKDNILLAVTLKVTLKVTLLLAVTLKELI